MQAALLLLLAGTLGGPPPMPDRTPYSVEPISHTVLTATAFGLLGLFTFVLQPQLSAEPDCVVRDNSVRCDEAALNPLDRWSVGNDSPAWRSVSDLGLVMVALTATAATAADAWGGTSRQPEEDFLVD